MAPNGVGFRPRARKLPPFYAKTGSGQIDLTRQTLDKDKETVAIQSHVADISRSQHLSSRVLSCRCEPRRPSARKPFSTRCTAA